MLLSTPRQISLLFVTLVLYCSHVHSVCFYPSGDQTPGDIACQDDSADSADSACCPQGYACINNGICMQTSVTPIAPDSTVFEWMRSSCTDSTWRSSQCPNFCQRGPPYNDVLNGTQSMGSCDGDALSTSGYYCVDSVASNCTTKENVILPDQDPVVLTTAGWKPETTTITRITTHLTSSITTILPATKSSNTSTITTSSPSSVSPAVRQSSSSPPATIIASHSSSSAHTIGLGAGLGVPLGLCLFAGIGWILFRRRRKGVERRQVNRASELPVEEPVHEASGPPQQKHWHRHELSGESWAPSEMPVDP